MTGRSAGRPTIRTISALTGLSTATVRPRLHQLVVGVARASARATVAREVRILVDPFDPVRHALVSARVVTRILVPGFYDRVRPVSDADRKALSELPDIDERLSREYGLARTEAGNARLAERILLPALNFRGVAAGAVGLEDAVNAIPSTARASIDFRLVPDQEPGAVRTLVEAHIAARGFHILRADPTLEERIRYPRLIKLEWDEGYPPYRLPLDDPFGAAVAPGRHGRHRDPLGAGASGAAHPAISFRVYLRPRAGEGSVDGCRPGPGQ